MRGRVLPPGFDSICTIVTSLGNMLGVGPRSPTDHQRSPIKTSLSTDASLEGGSSLFVVEDNTND